MKPKEELVLKYMLANEEDSNSSHGILPTTFTSEVRESLLNRKYIDYHNPSGNYYLTAAGKKAIEKRMNIIRVYPLANSRGTSQSFDMTFANASPAFFNKMFESLFKSNRLSVIPNTDFVLTSLLEQISGRISAAMLNKTYNHVSSLMEDKRKTLPAKVQLNVLDKVFRKAQGDLDNFLNQELEKAESKVYNVTLKKSLSGNSQTILLSINDVTRNGNVVKSITLNTDGVESTTFIPNLSVDIKNLIAQNVLN